MKLRYPVLLPALLSILLSTLLSCTGQNPDTNDHKPVEDSTSVTLTGKEIYAIYSHGGPLAQLSNANFEIENSSQKEIFIEIVRIAYIQGNRDTSLTIRTDKKLNITKAKLTTDSTNTLREAIIIKPHQIMEVDIMFDPIDVGISPHDNYQAIRLEIMAEGELIRADSRLIVEREKDLDKY